MEKNAGNDAWWRPSLLLFASRSSWIVAPILVGILFGKWLDARCGTEPWLFLTSVGLAFAISIFGLTKNATDEYQKIENKK
ncbi:MAG: AtpZ/AtpI family protein [Patescibacteria group bacterium]